MGSSAAQAKDKQSERLGPALESIAEEYERGGDEAAETRAAERGLKVTRGGEGPVVRVILEPQAGGSSTIDHDNVRGLGGEIDAVSDSYVRVLVPARHLRRLASHPDVKLVRAATPAKALGTGFGSNLSESVTLTGADQKQLSGTTGAGVKLAVIDLGFVGLQSAINAGELPASTIGVDFSGTGLETDTDHGVGVAEHAMDMAPGATLYLIKVSAPGATRGELSAPGA
jgi:hypothetical protein